MTHPPEFAAGILHSGKRVSALARNHKKLSVVILSTILLAVAVIAVVATRKNSGDGGSSAISLTSGINSGSHAILRSSCSSTRFPDLCFSTIASVPSISGKISSQKDVIEASINLTVTAVEHTYFKIEKLSKRKGLTVREVTALHDCLEDIDETIDELHKAYSDLVIYPSKKSLSQHADDLKILLSAAMTNQDSCIDGFSHEGADKEVRKELIDGLTHVYHMCSNSLAMIKNMTDTDMAIEAASAAGRRLDETADERGFPSWMSAADRRLLQSSSVTPDVVVAADGSGDFTTVSAAVAAAPDRSSKRYVIRIKAGVYKENVEVPKKKTNLMFLGDGRKTTIITGSRNVVDGSTTFKSATVAAVGEGFLATEITFENTAGPSKHQAVALRVGSDHSAFYRCDMVAYQDTLYVHSLRQFYRSCYIAGTVDFIFGNAAAVFQDCDIHARRPNSGQKNMVTAQGRDDPNQNTGISIQDSRIGATSDLLAAGKGSFETYLGRPWKEYSRTAILSTSIGDVIHAAGWHPWSGNFGLDTLEYREYLNTGPGAGTAERVTWKGHKVITSTSEAHPYTAATFIGGGQWLGSTGFPYSLGL